MHTLAEHIFTEMGFYTNDNIQIDPMWMLKEPTFKMTITGSNLVGLAYNLITDFLSLHNIEDQLLEILGVADIETKELLYSIQGLSFSGETITSAKEHSDEWKSLIKKDYDRASSLAHLELQQRIAKIIGDFTTLEWLPQMVKAKTITQSDIIEREFPGLAEVLYVNYKNANLGEIVSPKLAKIKPKNDQTNALIKAIYKESISNRIHECIYCEITLPITSEIPSMEWFPSDKLPTLSNHTMFNATCDINGNIDIDQYGDVRVLMYNLEHGEESWV